MNKEPAAGTPAWHALRAAHFANVTSDDPTGRRALFAHNTAYNAWLACDMVAGREHRWQLAQILELS